MLGKLVLATFARVDDEDHNDADEDGNDSGGRVVDHRTEAHLAWRSAVQGSHAWSYTEKNHSLYFWL